MAESVEPTPPGHIAFSLSGLHRLPGGSILHRGRAGDAIGRGRMAGLRDHQAAAGSRPDRPRSIFARRASLSGLRTRRGPLRPPQTGHVCYCGFALSSGLLWLIAWRESHSVHLIYAVVVLVGVVRAFNAPVSRALLPQLVPGEHFPNAVAWNASIFQAATILGSLRSAGFFTPSRTARRSFM